MSNKVSGTVRKGMGLLLAGLLAPALPYLDDVRRALSVTEEPGAVTWSVPVQTPGPTPTCARAKGSGSTPEAAFQSAFDAALQQAVAAEVSAADWSRYGRDYLASLRQNGTGVVRGWHEVSTGSERRLTGRVFHSEVSVEVDVTALRERLRSAGPVSRR